MDTYQQCNILDAWYNLLPFWNVSNMNASIVVYLLNYGIAYPSGASEFTTGFKWGSWYSIVSFMCMVCRSLFVLFLLAIMLFVLFNGFWLSLWYLQNLHTTSAIYRSGVFNSPRPPVLFYSTVNSKTILSI